MNKLTVKSIVGLAVASALMLGTANAHPKKQMFEELNLTDAQRQSLLSMKGDFQGKRAEAQAKRQEIKSLLQAGNVDAAADLVANIAREKVYKRAERFNQIKGILTEEQIATLKENRPERKGSKAKKMFKQFRELDLTPEQRSQLREQFAGAKGGKGEAFGKRKEVMQLMKAGRIDEAANLAAENARAMVYKRAEMKQNLKSILTEEQIQQLKANRAARKG